MRVYNVSDDVLTPVLYGMNNNGINEYYKEKVNKMKNYITSDSYLVDNYRDVEYRYSDDYVNKIKRSLRDLELTGNDETTLYYYKDSREANLATIEWIMANKKLSKLYDRGLINGYSNTNYIHNKYSSEVKYMSVMDGYLDEEEDCIVEYYNSDMEEISHTDRDIIMSNWSKALNMFNNNIDPTNK